MKVRQAISVAVALGSAVVGGALGTQALEQANAAPLSFSAHAVTPGSAAAVTPAARATARTGPQSPSTTRPG